MPIWDEQNIIGLALASSRHFVSHYIILIQKCTDKTMEVINYCKKLWNLNIEIINSDKKIRERREFAITISKQYADYYIIQDGDEIFYENTENEINKLIEQDITFSTAPTYYYYAYFGFSGGLNEYVPLIGTILKKLPNEPKYFSTS